jgi:hypothetical protein
VKFYLIFLNGAGICVLDEKLSRLTAFRTSESCQLEGLSYISPTHHRMWDDEIVFEVVYSEM